MIIKTITLESVSFSSMYKIRVYDASNVHVKSFYHQYVHSYNEWQTECPF